MKVIDLEKVSFRDIPNRKTVNALTADDKHYLLNRDNLREPIQMQLSEKQKKFSEFIFAFLKSIFNFEHFSKKDEPHSRCISESKGCEKRRYINV